MDENGKRKKIMEIVATYVVANSSKDNTTDNCPVSSLVLKNVRTFSLILTGNLRTLKMA